MNKLALVGLILVAACDVSPGAAEPSDAAPGDAAPGVSTTDAVGATAPSGEGAGDGMTCWVSPQDGSAAADPTFVDATADRGLVEPLVGMHAHAAVWSDFNGDDLPDLYVGTFADRDDEVYAQRGATGPNPDRLLVNQGDSFSLDDRLEPALTRTSGGAAADLDGDGDLDLVVSRNHRDPGDATTVLRNDEGVMVPVEAGLPETIGGRSVGVLDYDQDGLLDLFIAEDRWSDGNSVLMRNTGDLQFVAANGDAGLPDDIHGLGVAIADLSGDGLLDIFVSGSNRLFVADAPGSFVEADSSVFAWEFYNDEDDVAGVSVADVNRDGRLDIALGQHFNSTLDEGSRVPVRLYLNRSEGGVAAFEDVTEAAGLPGLPTKAPHVELNDFNNDGWPDLLTSASADGGAAVFPHLGLEGDVPTFGTPGGIGDPQYWVAAPTSDADQDGRLDFFLVEWEPSLPSLLMMNDTASGHWLEVSVGPEHGHGVNWRVEVYSGPAVELTNLIGARDITVTQGYSAGVAPVAHFGLGSEESVTVRLIPPGQEEIVLAEVGIDRHIRYPAGCG